MTYTELTHNSVTQQPEAEKPKPLAIRALVYSLCALMIVPPQAWAQVVSDPNAAIQFRPRVEVAPNGTPVVNIVNPTAAGISHNQYERYDVDAVGLILNNSRASGASQLGGQLAANSNLRGREASVIVNEVTSSRQSNLTGTTEVFGQRADVIVANPNGISCNGCSYINADSAGLVAGQTSYMNGKLHADVTRGNVTIGRDGISGARSVDLAGKQVVIDGKVSARDSISVQAGSARYRMDHAGVRLNRKLADSDASQSGIDATAFGALEAGKISIVANGAGVGVRSGAYMATTAEDLFIQADGDVAIRAGESAGNLTVQSTAGSVQVSGDLYADQSVNVSGNDIRFVNNQGIETYAGVVGITAENDLSADVRIRSRNTVTLSAGNNLAGDLTAITAGDVSVVSAGNASISNGVVVGNQVVLAADGDFTTEAETIVGAGVNIGAANVSLDKESYVESTERPILIIADHDVYNAARLDGPVVDVVAGDRFNNAAPGEVMGDIVAVRAADVENEGVIVSSMATDIAAENINNAASGAIESYGRVSLGANSSVTNSGLVNAGNVAIDAGEMILLDGVLVSASVLNVTSGQDIESDGSNLFASDEVTITANSDISLNGGLVHGSNAVIGAKNALVIEGTQVSAVEVATLVGNNVSLNGEVTSDNNVLITAGETLNQNGLVSAGQSAVVIATELNNAGAVASNGEQLLLAETIDNSGSVISNQVLTVSAEKSLNNTGIINSETDTRITASDLLNTTDGLLRGARSLTIEADSVENSGNGWLGSDSIDIQSDQLSNSAEILAGRSLIVGAEQLKNQGLIRSGQLNLDVVEIINSADDSLQGSIVADDLQLSRTELLTNSGAIVSGSNLTLDLPTLDNSSGYLEAVELTVNTDGAINNSAGVLSADRLILNAESLINDQQGSTVYGVEAVEIVVSEALENSGDIVSAGIVSARSDTAITNNGLIEAGGRLELETVGTVTNNATLSSLNFARIDAADFDNRNGNVSGSVLAITVTSDINNDGSLGELNGSDTLYLETAGDFNNTADRSESEGLNAEGVLEKTVTFETKSLIADGSLVIKAAGDINNQGGLLSAANTLAIEAGGDINNDALVEVYQQSTTQEGSDRYSYRTILGRAWTWAMQKFTTVNNAAAAADSVITASGNLDLRSGGDISNIGGTIEAAGNSSLAAEGDIVNGSKLTSYTAERENRDERYTVRFGRFRLPVDYQSSNSVTELVKQQGTISADNNLTLRSQGELSNLGGKLTAGADLTIDSESGVTNRNVARTIITSGSYLKDDARAAVSTYTREYEYDTTRLLGEVEAGGVASVITAGDILNDAGRIAGGSGLYLEAGGDLINKSSMSSDYKTLSHVNKTGKETIRTRNSRNGRYSNRTVYHRELDRQVTTELAAVQGELSSGGALVANISGHLTNEGGVIESSGSLLLEVEDGIRNAAGAVHSHKDFEHKQRETNWVREQVTGDETKHRNIGTIQSGGGMTLLTSADLNNEDFALIDSVGHLGVVAENFELAGSELNAGSAEFEIANNFTVLGEASLNTAGSLIATVGNTFKAAAERAKILYFFLTAHEMPAHFTDTSINIGGDAEITASDVLLDGASLNIAGSATIDATNDISVITHAEAPPMLIYGGLDDRTDEFIVYHKGGELSNDAVDRYYDNGRVSEATYSTYGQWRADGAINAGNSLSLTAGNDIALDGGKFTAGENLYAWAGNDISLQSHADVYDSGSTEHKESYYYWDRDAYSANYWGSKYVPLKSGNVTVRTENEDIVERRATIAAGNDVVLNAGKDFDNVGGLVNAQANLNIRAANGVNNNGFELNFVAQKTRVSGTEKQYGYYYNGYSKRYSRRSRLDKTIQISESSEVAGVSDTHGVLSAAGDVVISAGTSFNSDGYGEIAGHNVQVVAADAINSTGGTANALNDLTLSADTDIRLAGGDYAAGNKLSLTAGQNIVTTAMTETDASGHNTEITAITRFTAESSDVDFYAGRDIALESSELSAGNDVILTAANRLSITTATEHAKFSPSHQFRSTGHGRVSERAGITTTVKHREAELSAAGDIRLDASTELQLRGANLSSGNNIELSSAELVDLQAVKDSSHFYKRRTKDHSFGGYEVWVDESMLETVTGGELTAGNKLLINAKEQADGSVARNANVGGVIIAGVDALAGQDLVVVGDSVEISGLAYLDAEQHTYSEKGHFGLSSSASLDAMKALKLSTAKLQAVEGDLNIVSDGSMSMIAADLLAGDEINLQAVDNILISSGNVITQSEQWSKSSRFNIGNFLSGGLFGGDIFSMSDVAAGVDDQKVRASTLAGNSVAVDAGRVTVIGSEINAGEAGLRINSDIGDIQVLAAAEKVDSYSRSREIGLSMGEGYEMLSEGIEHLYNPDSQAKMTFARATYDSVKHREEDLKHAAAILRSEGGIVLDSIGDLLIEGSQLHADINGDGNGDVNLHADGNVTIKEAKDIYHSVHEETHGQGEASVVVQHQAVEVAKAVLALKEARELVKEAREALNKYKKDLRNLKKTLAELEAAYNAEEPGVSFADVVELEEIVNDVSDDEEYFVAGVVLAAANVVSKVTLLYQQTAALASSVGTWGFNAGLQLDLEASKSKTEVTETTSLASAVTGNNIFVSTGTGDDNTATIQGSHLEAANGITVEADVVDILASRDSYRETTESEQGSLTVGVTVYGGAGGPTVSADYNRSKNSDRNTNYTNSTITADDITVTSLGDTTVRGGSIRAHSSLLMNVGGDLAVESEQNRARGSGSSFGISAGVSLGGGEIVGANGGFNTSSHASSSRETVLTSITSGGDATINVTGATSLVGATIATIDDNGDDLGKLVLRTARLDSADLRNTNFSTSTSFAVSGGLSFGSQGQEITQDANGNPIPAPAAQPAVGENTGYRDGIFVDSTAPNNAIGVRTGTGRGDGELDVGVGTSNISYSNNTSYQASNTMATLGEGTIIIDGVEVTGIERLNRDVSQTSRDLFSVDRQQGNINLTIDSRLLSDEGRAQIRLDIERTSVLTDSFMDMVTDSSVALFGDGEVGANSDGVNSLGEQIARRNRYLDASLQFASDPNNEELVRVLLDGNATPEAQAAAYTALASHITSAMGIPAGEARLLVSDQFPGAKAFFTAETPNQFYIVIDNNRTTADAIGSVGNETSDRIDLYENGGVENTSAIYINNRTSNSDIMGSALEDYLGFALEANGYDPLGAVLQHNGANQNNAHIATTGAVVSQLDASSFRFRQLRPEEVNGINHLANELRRNQAANGMSRADIDDFVGRLARQRLRETDARWRAAFAQRGDGDWDEEASRYLQSANSRSDLVGVFGSVTVAEYENDRLGADYAATGARAFYQEHIVDDETNNLINYQLRGLSSRDQDTFIAAQFGYEQYQEGREVGSLTEAAEGVANTYRENARRTQGSGAGVAAVETVREIMGGAISSTVQGVGSLYDRNLASQQGINDVDTALGTAINSFNAGLHTIGNLAAGAVSAVLGDAARALPNSAEQHSLELTNLFYGDSRTAFTHGALQTEHGNAFLSTAATVASGGASGLVVRGGNAARIARGADGSRPEMGALGSAENSIYLSRRPIDQEFPELVGVNPHYVQDAPRGVNTNCVSCTNAAQERISGANPEAIAENTQGYARSNELLPSAPLGRVQNLSVSDVVQRMRNEGNGSYGVVVIHQPNSTVQHAINVVNRDGNVVFIDNQSGHIVDLNPNLTLELGTPLEY